MHPTNPIDTFLMESNGEIRINFEHLTCEAKKDAGPVPIDLPMIWICYDLML